MAISFRLCTYFIVSTIGTIKFSPCENTHDNNVIVFPVSLSVRGIENRVTMYLLAVLVIFLKHCKNVIL